jgi:hypothetical protein
MMDVFGGTSGPKPRLAVLAAAVFLVAGASYAQAPTPPAPPTPCLSDPKYKEFDFWVGTWDVHPNGKPEQQAGTNVITKLHKDCVILESWTGARGMTGSSFNIYDASRGRWSRTWVDSTGGLHEYSGSVENGNMVYFGDLAAPAGHTGRVRTRLTLFNQGPDRVRQLSERTTDGGKTWAVNYDLIYTRRKPGAP